MDSIFLGDSQTFLGTIATLTILCVFSEQDSGNFIVSVLKGIRERIEKQIKLLKENTNMVLPESIQLLQYFLGQTNVESEQNNEGVQILREIAVKENELKSQYTMRVEFRKDELFRQIKDAKEQFLAPLYTFLYCLIVFVFDELLRVSHIGKEWLVSGMALFTFYSYLFWTVIWVKFFVTHRVGYRKREKSFIPECLMNEWNDISLRVRNSGCSWSFILRVASCLLVIIACILLAHDNPNVSIGILIAGLSIPVFVKGYSRVNCFFDNGDYSHLFLVGHFAALFVLSFLLTFVIHYIVHYDVSFKHILIPYENFLWMKSSVLCFALFNGIVFPFLFPFLCYNSLYVHAKKIARNTKKEQKKIIKGLESRLKALYAKDLSPQLVGNQEKAVDLGLEEKGENDFGKYYQEYENEKQKGIKIIDFCQEKGIDVSAFREYRKKRLKNK